MPLQLISVEGRALEQLSGTTVLSCLVSSDPTGEAYAPFRDNASGLI